LQEVSDRQKIYSAFWTQASASWSFPYCDHILDATQHVFWQLLATIPAGWQAKKFPRRRVVHQPITHD